MTRSCLTHRKLNPASEIVDRFGNKCIFLIPERGQSLIRHWLKNVEIQPSLCVDVTCRRFGGDSIHPEYSQNGESITDMAIGIAMGDGLMAGPGCVACRSRVNLSGRYRGGSPQKGVIP
jgi:hypothetical protein